MHHEDGVPILNINADAIAEKKCLPYSNLQFTMEENKDKVILKKEYVYAQNLDMIARIGGSEIFRLNKLRGNWLVD